MASAAPRALSMWLRSVMALGIVLITGLVMSVGSGSANTESVDFVCEDRGQGLSAVDVLSATGEHEVFLDYLRDYDPEGYEILTESDQRVRTRVEGGAFSVQDVRIGPTAWCTQAGSIFSIDEVMTDVAIPGWFERTLGLAIYFVFFQYPVVSAVTGLALALLTAPLMVHFLRKRRTRN